MKTITSKWRQHMGPSPPSLAPAAWFTKITWSQDGVNLSGFFDLSTGKNSEWLLGYSDDDEGSLMILGP